MTDDETVERIAQSLRHELTPGRIGRHAVLTATVDLPAGVLTIVHRVLDGSVTVVRASGGSFREDVAEGLLDLPLESAPTVRPIALDVPGLELNRALVLGPDSGDDLDGRTTTVVAVHHSEVLPGETVKDFDHAASSKGTGLHVDDWNRRPVPRADVRLLDDWPGGPMRRSKKPHPTRAERTLGAVVPDAAAGVRVEVHTMRGHTLVLQRQWDRVVGSLTGPDGTTEPVDLPRTDLWAALGPVFLTEDLRGLITTSPGTPETDVLEMRYQTEQHGWASLPLLQALDSCVARLDRQILRAPGNWAVFTSRSGAAIQVTCTRDGLWLETPDPATRQSRGRLMTVQEAASLLEILAREDRSAVAESAGTEIIAWD